MEGSTSKGPTELSLETFAPVVGETFTVGGEEGSTVELLLVEATAKDAGPHAPRPPFSLIFQGPAEPFLPQATYRFEHGSLGEMGIFVVPLGHDEHGASYEAFFA
ncbi:MAG TPA: hypothetical protein VGV69_00735 [Solirubrobacterales bacterium]|nr:hypothetical protein [Solirubrobacterales bacterium]